MDNDTYASVILNPKKDGGDWDFTNALLCEIDGASPQQAAREIRIKTRKLSSSMYRHYHGIVYRRTIFTD